MVTGKKRITYGKVFLYLFTSLIAACCFLPILLIVIVSFTSEQAIVHKMCIRDRHKGVNSGKTLTHSMKPMPESSFQNVCRC